MSSGRAPVRLLVLLVILAAPLCAGYSVLTHEEMVDLLWKDQIAPLLLKRFPQATDDDLHQAHAFAYGGALVADMGYYPFGNKLFSDMAHYVRSGDFVTAMLTESSDLNEYAFALGALSHYVADNTGHPTINHVVAMEFPQLRRKFGDFVTYSDDHKSHIRTEFGFDMVQVAKNRYTSDSYHDFIGFEVSQPILERAFVKTYGLELKDVLGDEDLAIGTFRFGVSQVIPQMTRVALLSRKKEIVRDTPNFNEKRFLYHLSRASYDKEWGTMYRKPGVGARILAFFLRIIPKVGPFSALNFKIPTTQTEDLYIKSVNSSVENYGALLRDVRHQELHLANIDCDTGRETKAGEYSLADTTYARLLSELAKRDFQAVTPELRVDILGFYQDLNVPIATKKKKKDWQTTMDQLNQLKARSVAEASANPTVLCPAEDSSDNLP